STDSQGPSVVRPFITEHQINYPIAMETSKIRNDVGGIDAIPTTFIIDRNGMLIAKYIGTTSKETFMADILPLLAAGEQISLSAAFVDGRLRISWPLTASGYT